MAAMKYLAALAFVLSTTAYADNQYCFDEVGALIDIPKGKKLILVPKGWNTEDVYIEQHKAMAIVRVKVKECDNGELVISPGYCPQEVQPPVVEAVQCDSDVLVISPSTCPE
jgi:hypothetical protein